MVIFHHDFNFVHETNYILQFHNPLCVADGNNPILAPIPCLALA
jgi:hypothetical protein